MLVANLGKLAVENQFLYASNPETNGYKFSASRSRHCGRNGDDDDENDSDAGTCYIL